MPATHAQQTCATNRNLHYETCTKNLTQVHHSFLAPKQLSGQSRCTVRVTCRKVSVQEQSCVLLRARNLYQKKICTRLTDTRASYLYRRLVPVCGTSFLSVCRRHKTVIIIIFTRDSIKFYSAYRPSVRTSVIRVDHRTRKPCCRKETARCRKCSLPLKFANNIHYKYKKD